MYKLSIAYLLWLVSGFGALGFHRFYLGKFFTGLLWMFTGGLGMIGSIYDLFTLPAQVNDANMRNVFFNEAKRRREYNEEEQQENNWRYASDAQYRTIDNDE
jgi:TM2 domain-containing membrane protein YozV